METTEQPLQIPPTRPPRRRAVWPKGWRITAVVLVVVVSMLTASAVVNHEVNRRLATIPLATTTSSQPATTVAVSGPKPPEQLVRQSPVPIVVEAPTTTTTQVVAQEVPKSAYDIITKLDALPVADEHTLGYTRYRYGAWRDDDGDGCTTRHDVLVTQAIEVVSRTRPCGIVSGEWVSSYDNATVDDPDHISVDHVVGLYESWKSGGWKWDDAQRNDYLNDLKTRNAVVAVSRASQQSKAGRDPKQWLPANDAFRCQYLQEWVDAKTVWKLSVDPGERESIAAAALNC